VVVVLATSACGTLQIDTEPAGSVNESAGSAADVSMTVVSDSTLAPVEAPTETADVEEASEPVNEASEITEEDETWRQFTDYRLGISIRFPREMATFRGSCTWKEDEGSFRPEPALVPVQIFEDTDAVYIAPEYYHELAEEWQDGGRTYYDACNLVTNSIELLQDPNAFKEPYWELVVEDVQNEAELDGFIKARYGSGCSVGEQLPSLQDGVYDVRIQGDGKDLAESQCPLNFATVVKYFPAGNKVVAWDRGQSYSFPADVNYSVVYDQEMEDSFRFLTESSSDEDGMALSSPAIGETEGTSGNNTSDGDYQGWQPYHNAQLGYSLMVPGAAEVMSQDPNERVAFIGPEIEGKPQFQFMIVHYDIDSAAADTFMQDIVEGHRTFLESMSEPTEGQVEELVIAGEPAIRTIYPAINGAEPRDDYSFVHEGQMYTISITHFDGLEDEALNELFLQSFTFEQS
jgi:hypothetical protein